MDNLSARSVFERLEAMPGDITVLAVDAIVNAANTTLLGGGGVDGAIHRAAGPGLRAECATLGGCPTGEARLTAGHQLPARHVIHTVGPVYRDGEHGEPEALAGCYRRSLELASHHGLRSLAFPAISCGAYGYPIAAAARIAVETVVSYLRDHPEIDTVLFVLYGDDTLAVYQDALVAARRRSDARRSIER
ncbi:MAG: O-acetyl-ADP-ribose deacetylase [Candidatus Eiseniibacteriota bacterium]|jgi:O-acetyl-ADP-ribose deacetylase (regulator of RNase III)